MIFTLLFRIFSIVSDFLKFHEEVNYLKDVLKKNYFPTSLVGKCIKIFLNKQFTKNIRTYRSHKKSFIVLPCPGMSPLYLKTHLQKSINRNISFCKIKIIFESSKRLTHFFRFKEKIPLCLHSNIVYQFVCGTCNATCCVDTSHRFKIRVGENLGISPLTNKRFKSKKSTAIKDHMLFCDQQVSFDHFKVLATSTLSSI